MRGRFGVARSLWASALVLPLSGVLLLPASPASAEIRSPESTKVFSAHETFPITATQVPIAATQFVPSELFLTPPGGQEIKVAEGGITDSEVTHQFNTLCRDAEGKACSVDQPGDRPALNGFWKVRQAAQAGAFNDESFFRLRIPPRPPSEVTALGSSPREMRVSWRRGSEPDLTGFTVFEGAQVAKEGIALDACNDLGACSTAITYPADGTGEHTYTVRALRSPGPGVEEDPLPSEPSASASATVLPAGTPGPVGGIVPGTAGPGSPASASPPGGPTASRPGGVNTAARRQAFSSGFSAFGPKLGVPKLPPLPQAPAVAQLPDGTFEPTLGYEDQELGPPGGVAARVTSTVGAAFVSEQIVRSTAGALVLLLAGAHLRRWLSTAPPE